MSETLVLPESKTRIPGHVTPDVVRSVDFMASPKPGGCPFSVTAQLHQDSPRIFWNPDSSWGGAWIPTHGEDMRFILTQPDLFTNKGEAGFSRLMGESWDLVPLELDPPEHTTYRSLLNGLLSPSVVARLTPGITARAVELIEAVREKGECEFLDAFGRPFPVSIFMQLMGLPGELTDQFLAWEFDLLHDPSMDKKVAAAFAIRDYLATLAADRRAYPTGDLTSSVVTAKIDGELLTDERVKGMLYLLFVGGLDTVASSLGFFFRHLAEHPDQQARLRREPALVDRAVEELLRRFSVVTVHRQCLSDVELGGVRMKAGDWITLNTSLGSLDPESFDDPLAVDLNRRNVRHFGFSFGPHFCAGSHLARRELTTALREWLARIPTWRIKANEAVQARGGGVYGVERLVLSWA